MNKKVLYISYDGMTDPLGQSQVLPYLSKLSKENLDFHLISFEKEIAFEKNKATIQQICDAANITWHPIKYTKKPAVFSTLWDIYHMSKKASDLQAEHHFSIVHCRSYISSLIGLKMKRKHNIPFIFDMRGFWADERVDGNIWDLKSPFYKFIYTYFKKKEKLYLAESDKIISLTSAGKQVILDWNVEGVKDAKIDVIPCCVNLELFNPSAIKKEEQAKLRIDLAIQAHNYVLGYVGSIGTWYMLSEMLDYFIELKKTKESAKFLFVTGESAGMIWKTANNKGIAKEDLIITSCIHSEVANYISLFDFSIFFIRPTFSKKASSPTKQGEIMAMGIPLVCNHGVGDTDFIVEKYKSGLVIKDFTPTAYQEIIASDFEFNTAELKAGAKDYFSLEQGFESYLKVYKSLL